MPPIQQLIVPFLISFLTTLTITPVVRRMAINYGLVDKPEKRKMHRKKMPTMGGIAILIGAAAGFFSLSPPIGDYAGIIIGTLIIVFIGILDDKYTLSPKLKLLGQTAAAICAMLSGVTIQFIHLPFYGIVELGVFSFLITWFWIVGVTNAINLIDGLDGLAAGVVSIALLSMLVVSILQQQYAMIPLTIILIGSTLGFLPYNFHPANIFMGDTGAMFLGYVISVISTAGLLKSVTLFSLIVPILILAVPIFDTFFAILRRLLNNQDISSPDKSHLHHRLISKGFGHRTSVLIIYSISIFFGLIAILFTTIPLKGAFVILIAISIFIQLTAEMIELIGHQRQPILHTFRKIIKKTRRLANL